MKKGITKPAIMLAISLLVGLLAVPASAIPVCSFTISPNPAECPGVVTLDASSSTGNPPLYYYWDTDGDGQFDDATGMIVTGVTLGPPGTYSIGLAVLDADYIYDVCFNEVQVIDTLPPDWYT